VGVSTPFPTNLPVALPLHVNTWITGVAAYFYLPGVRTGWPGVTSREKFGISIITPGGNSWLAKFYPCQSKITPGSQ